MHDNTQYVTGNYLALPYLVPIFDEFFPLLFSLPLSLLFVGLYNCGDIKMHSLYEYKKKERQTERSSVYMLNSAINTRQTAFFHFLQLFVLSPSDLCLL